MRDMTEMKRGKEGRKRAHSGNQRAARVLEMKVLEGELVTSALYSELDRDSGGSVYLAKLE